MGRLQGLGPQVAPATQRGRDELSEQRTQGGTELQDALAGASGPSNWEPQGLGTVLGLLTGMAEPEHQHQQGPGRGSDAHEQTGAGAGGRPVTKLMEFRVSQGCPTCQGTSDTSLLG